MSRIIWRRVRTEWVGRLTKDGPDRFVIGKDHVYCRGMQWRLTDLQLGRAGLYARLTDAKATAEAQR